MICAHCSKPLTARWQIIFCSRQCGGAHQGAPPRVCKCGKHLTHKQKFHCSPQCRSTEPRQGKTSRQDETIKRLAEEGGTRASIAEACGIALGTVSRRCKVLGIVLASSWAAYKNPQEDAIKKMALSGASYDEIMQSFGISRSTAMKYRRVLGLADEKKARNKGPRSRAIAVLKPIELRHPIRLQLREIYQHGFTLDLPRAQRGDLEALNRAMHLEDPEHPGFVLADRAQLTRVGLYAR